MKRAEKRKDLQERLIEAASASVAKNGLGQLRARDIAETAGCALGAIYTIFDDLDELILHVNSRTLKALERDISGATDGIDEPSVRLVALADAYLGFAYRNRLLWKAIFDHRLPEGRDIPDWYLAEHAFLVGFIVDPLLKIAGERPRAAVELRARTLFASVHGIVALSLDKTFIELDFDSLRTELLDFVRSILPAGSGG